MIKKEGCTRLVYGLFYITKYQVRRVGDVFYRISGGRQTVSDESPCVSDSGCAILRKHLENAFLEERGFI